MSASKPSQNRARLVAHLRRHARWRWPEILFWLTLLALIFAIPSRAALINEILIAGLFALSLDLILGLTGIVSLGHAAFFGLGAYSAAILSAEGIADPTLGLVLSSLIAAALGLATAPLLLRGADLTRLMVTMGIALMLGELANRNSWITGGADGLEIAMIRREVATPSAPARNLFSRIASSESPKGDCASRRANANSRNSTTKL